MAGIGRRNRRKRSWGERWSGMKAWVRSLVGRLVPVAFLVAVALGLPAGLFWAYINTFSGHYFQVEVVEVSGLARVEREDLLAKAGFDRPVNIFDVDAGRVEQAMESMAWVKSARVERRMPDRVEVEVEEYEPVAVLVDGGFYVVDRGAHIIEKLSVEDAREGLFELPLVGGIDVKAGSPEERQGALGEALKVVLEYREQGLDRWQPLSEVHVDDVLGVSVVTAETGTEIRLGRGRIEERLERLGVVKSSLVERGIDAEYILIDQESDLSRVAVGRRVQPKDGEPGRDGVTVLRHE